MDIDAAYVALAQAVTDAEIMVGTAKLTTTSHQPEAVVVPHFFGADFTVQYHKAYGGLIHVQMNWWLLLSRADDQSGQKNARDLASSTGTGSLLLALEAARGAPGEPALGGAAQDFQVEQVSGPRLYTVGVVEYYGLKFGLFAMG